MSLIEPVQAPVQQQLMPAGAPSRLAGHAARPNVGNISSSSSKALRELGLVAKLDPDLAPTRSPAAVGGEQPLQAQAPAESGPGNFADPADVNCNDSAECTSQSRSTEPVPAAAGSRLPLVVTVSFHPSPAFIGLRVQSSPQGTIATTLVYSEQDTKPAARDSWTPLHDLVPRLEMICNETLEPRPRITIFADGTPIATGVPLFGTIMSRVYPLRAGGAPTTVDAQRRLLVQAGEDGRICLYRFIEATTRDHLTKSSHSPSMFRVVVHCEVSCCLPVGCDDCIPANAPNQQAHEKAAAEAAAAASTQEGAAAAASPARSSCASEIELMSVDIHALYNGNRQAGAHVPTRAEHERSATHCARKPGDPRLQTDRPRPHVAPDSEAQQAHLGAATASSADPKVAFSLLLTFSSVLLPLDLREEIKKSIVSLQGALEALAGGKVDRMVLCKGQLLLAVEEEKNPCSKEAIEALVQEHLRLPPKSSVRIWRKCTRKRTVRPFRLQGDRGPPKRRRVSPE